jgi:outer membrane biosynthesis protein TonB
MREKKSGAKEQGWLRFGVLALGLAAAGLALTVMALGTSPRPAAAGETDPLPVATIPPPPPPPPTLPPPPPTLPPPPPPEILLTPVPTVPPTATRVPPTATPQQQVVAGVSALPRTGGAETGSGTNVALLALGFGALIASAGTAGLALQRRGKD